MSSRAKRSPPRAKRSSPRAKRAKSQPCPKLSSYKESFVNLFEKALKKHTGKICTAAHTSFIKAVNKAKTLEQARKTYFASLDAVRSASREDKDLLANGRKRLRTLIKANLDRLEASARAVEAARAEGEADAAEINRAEIWRTLKPEKGKGNAPSGP